MKTRVADGGSGFHSKKAVNKEVTETDLIDCSFFRERQKSMKEDECIKTMVTIRGLDTKNYSMAEKVTNYKYRRKRSE